jgi:hypothetical protein
VLFESGGYAKNAKLIILRWAHAFLLLIAGCLTSSGDVIIEEEKLLVATPELLKNRFNIQACTDNEVLSINKPNKTLDVRDLVTGQNRGERYDPWVLLTGTFCSLIRYPT